MDKKIISPNEKKQKRARSEKDKSKKFELILEAGADLFCIGRFSLRKLADKLGMSMPNLYHYVQSKRELWIAIRKKYFKVLKDELSETIKEHQGTYIKLILKLIDCFLDFSAFDFRRFGIMFILPAPSSKKIGPIEKSYKPYNLLNFLREFAQKAIDDGEIKEDNAIKLTLFLYEITLGAAIVEFYSNIKMKEDILEPMKFGSDKVNINENRKYFKRQVKRLLTIMSL
ncbi:MAG: TetR/AcrR family transcriptional regulator [Promethearchaeota archaeon]